jgi:hypothetical protein
MNRRLTGQILRMLGLLIELLGIVALALWTRTDAAGAPLPGSFSARQVWIAVGVGFVIWLAGSLLLYLPGPSSAKQPPDKPDHDALQL